MLGVKQSQAGRSADRKTTVSMKDSIRSNVFLPNYSAIDATRVRVVTTADERRLVGDLGVQREQFQHVDSRDLGLDWLERSADFDRRVRFHCRTDPIGSDPEIENHDAGAVVSIGDERGWISPYLPAGHHQPAGPERDDLQEIPARDTIVSPRDTAASQILHPDPQIVTLT